MSDIPETVPNDVKADQRAWNVARAIAAECNGTIPDFHRVVAIASHHYGDVQRCPISFHDSCQLTQAMIEVGVIADASKRDAISSVLRTHVVMIPCEQ